MPELAKEIFAGLKLRLPQTCNQDGYCILTNLSALGEGAIKKGPIQVIGDLTDEINFCLKVPGPSDRTGAERRLPCNPDE